MSLFVFLLVFYAFHLYLIALQILFLFLSIIGASCFHFSVVFSLVWHNPSLPHNLPSQCFIGKVCCFCVSTYFCAFPFSPVSHFIANLVLVSLCHWHLSLSFFCSIFIGLAQSFPTTQSTSCLHSYFGPFIPVLVQSSQLFLSPFHYIYMLFNHCLIV